MDQITKKLVELDRKCLWHPFTQMKQWLACEPAVIESGDGFYLIDTEGNRYIDGVSSLWCNVHGHKVKKIDDAIKDQLDKIAHSTLLGLAQTRSIELAEKLVALIEQGDAATLRFVYDHIDGRAVQKQILSTESDEPFEIQITERKADD